MPLKQLPNGEKIEVSDLDTSTTLKQKIALAYKLDLRFMNEFTVDKTTDLARLNIVTLPEEMDTFISEHIDDEEAFYDFYRQTKTIYTRVEPVEFVNLWRLAVSRYLIQPLLSPDGTIPSHFRDWGFTADDFADTSPIETKHPKTPLPHDRGARVIARELDGRQSDGTSYRIALYQRDLADYATIIDRIARAYNVQTQFLNLKVVEQVRPPPGPPYRTEHIIDYANAILNVARHICPMLQHYIDHDNFSDFVNEARQLYHLSNNDYIRLWLTIGDGKNKIYQKNLQSDIEVLRNEDEDFRHLNFNLDQPPQIDKSPSSAYKTKTDELDEAASEFEHIETGDVAITDFEQTKQFLSININNPHRYPMEYIFDQLKLTPDIPFAAYDTYCKVYRNFILNGDVNVTPASIVLLYRRDIAYDDAPTQTAHSQHALWMSYYSTVRLRFPESDSDPKTEDDEKHTTVLLEMDVHMKANLDVIRKHLQAVLQNVFDDHAMQQGTTKKESGELYILGQNIDIFVLKDVLLFHPVFKHMFYINDNATSTGLAMIESRYPTHAAIYYIDPQTSEKFTCQILTRQFKRADIANNTISNLHSTMNPPLKLGQPITVYRFNRGERSTINRFKPVLAKLMATYRNNEGSITDFYRKYVTPVNDREFKESENTLSEINPDVFVEKYSRLCNPAERLPTFIEPGEQHPKDKDAVIEFPDKSDMFFKCSDPEYKYMGVMENKLVNSGKYPFIPCCFKNEQKSKKKFSDYTKQLDDARENDDDDVNNVKTRKDRLDDPLKAYKFAEHGIHGVLPANLVKLFRIANINTPNNLYLRRGMHTTSNLAPSTFIECILEAIGDPNFVRLDDERARYAYLKKERKAIADFIVGNKTGVHMQECFDISNEELVEQLNNEKIYISPLIYIRIMEEKYNITIIPLTRDEPHHRYGDFLVPRHAHGFAYMFPPLNRKRRVVIVYEHKGGIYNTNKSCELVVRRSVAADKKFEVSTSLSVNDDVAKIIYHQYVGTMSAYYSTHNRAKKDRLPYPPHIDSVKVQYIDMYGKTRALCYGDDKFVYCEPIAPLNKPYTFAAPPVLDNDEFARVVSKLGETNLHFTNLALSTPDIPNDHVRARRSSAHLIEYSLYLFSKFMADHPDELVTTLLPRFTQEVIKVDPEHYNYEFPYVLDASDNVVHVETDLIRKKLIYMMRVHLLNNRTYVIDYHKKLFMQQYYQHPIDFKTFSDTVVYDLVYYKQHSRNYATQLYLTPPPLAILEQQRLHACPGMNAGENCSFHIQYNSKNYIGTHYKTIEEAIGASPKVSKFICIPFVGRHYQKTVKVSTKSDDGGEGLVIYARLDNRPESVYYIRLHTTAS
jgi:Family of unknown function (DUF5757)